MTIRDASGRPTSEGKDSGSSLRGGRCQRTIPRNEPKASSQRKFKICSVVDAKPIRSAKAPQFDHALDSRRLIHLDVEFAHIVQKARDITSRYATAAFQTSDGIKHFVPKWRWDASATRFDHFERCC